MPPDCRPANSSPTTNALICRVERVTLNKLAQGPARVETLVIAFIDAHRARFGVEPICAVLSEHGVTDLLPE